MGLVQIEMLQLIHVIVSRRKIKHQITFEPRWVFIHGFRGAIAAGQHLVKYLRQIRWSCIKQHYIIMIAQGTWALSCYGHASNWDGAILMPDELTDSKIWSLRRVMGLIPMFFNAINLLSVRCNGTILKKLLRFRIAVC